MKAVSTHRVLAVLCVLASHASAQLVTTSDVQRVDSFSNLGSFTELPGGAFTPSSSLVDGSLSFAMTGDLRLELDPGAIPQVSRRVTMSGSQQFEIGGLLPMQITPEIFSNYKIVHAGGPGDVAYGLGTANALLYIYESGSYVNGDPTYAGLGQQVLSMGIGSGVGLQGSGFKIVDNYASDSPYVLLPGVNYTAVWSFFMRDVITGLDPDDPAAATYFEAGGISGFDGIRFNLRAVTVPTPGGAVLAGVGGLVMARRRRG